MSRAGTFNLNRRNSAEIRTGEPYSFKFRVLDLNGNPLDFAGQSNKAQLRLRPRDALIADFAITVFSPTHSELTQVGPLVGGWIEIALTKAQTTALAIDDQAPSNPYWWDLFLGDRCYLEGSVEIVWSITEDT